MKTFETISLLPYLESSHGGLHLEIPMDGDSKRTDQNFPFQLVDTPRPFSRLVLAEIKANPDSIFNSLFLLVQGEEPLPEADGLSQNSNTSIESLWQQTHAAYSQEVKSPHGFIPFPGGGDTVPCFKPLLFCKKKHLFFHPPCPVCGNELTLCRDDKRLIHAGLHPFSTSTQRYLACPDCLGTNENTPFYKWSRTHRDGIFVKDRNDLIVDFKNLRSPGARVCGFPCTTCPLHSECYILDRKACERISFFAFYPFHMLMFKAPTLNAVNFLALASGADLAPDDPPRFFFKNDKRYFLEILLIKLSFLKRVLDILGTRADQPICSGTGLTAQSLWITPLEGTTPLPWLWNFKITMIDLLNITSGNNHSTAFSTHAFFNFYSTLWFYTLAVNKTQPLEMVLNEIDNGQAPLDSPILSMAQIFWDPDQFQGPQTYHDFWIEACSLGKEIRNVRGDTPLAREIEKFSQKIDLLNQKIQAALFSTAQNFPMEAMETRPLLKPTENQTLVRILTAIAQRWSMADPIPPGEVAPSEQGTSLLEAQGSSEQGTPFKVPGKIEKPAPFPAPDLEEDTDEDILETVTLYSFSADTDEDENGDEDNKSTIPPSMEDDFLEKTMIMTLPKEENDPGSAPVPSPTSNASQEEFTDQGFEDLEETLILTPGKQNQEKKP